MTYDEYIDGNLRTVEHDCVRYLGGLRWRVCECGCRYCSPELHTWPRPDIQEPAGTQNALVRSKAASGASLFPLA